MQEGNYDSTLQIPAEHVKRLWHDSISNVGRKYRSYALGSLLGPLQTLLGSNIECIATIERR